MKGGNLFGRNWLRVKAGATAWAVAEWAAGSMARAEWATGLAAGEVAIGTRAVPRENINKVESDSQPKAASLNMKKLQAPKSKY